MFSALVTSISLHIYPLKLAIFKKAAKYNTTEYFKSVSAIVLSYLTSFERFKLTILMKTFFNIMALTLGRT